MKNMKLFPKTVLHSLCLIVGMTLVVFVLIYSLLPAFYRQYKQREVASWTERLASELQGRSMEQIVAGVSDYAFSKGYGYAVSDENGEMISAAGAGMSFEIIGGQWSENSAMQLDFEFAQSEENVQAADGKTVRVSLNVSLQPIGDAMSVLLILLPVVLVFCFIIAAVVAYFYAKSIAKPIQDITRATVQMQSLIPAASCPTNREDEIGELARNVNTMYGRLLSTISDLEREIENVGKAEQEKLDFLLLASHEMKTPVTAIRGMIDGMIYKVGVYKDRDAYLLECQKVLEGLTELICRILETSKIDASMAARQKENTDIGRLLEEVAAPYFIIAQNRNIEMIFSKENDFCAMIPAELMKKAFSNILSNAVKYTEENHFIRIYMKSETVVIENECNLLSEEELSHIGEPFYHPSSGKQEAGSTGLGLYLTDRILSACGLAYSFKPYENGMRFTLYF